MQTVVIVVHLMIVVVLIGTVLLQKSEGGGLGMGGGAGFMSSRGTANLLTRTTAILAVCFFATSLLLSWLASFNRAPASIVGPAPASQSQPPLNYRPKPTPRVIPTPPPSRPLIIQPSVPNLPDQSQQSEVTPPTPAPLPVTPPPEAPPSYQIQQPVLPAIFRGCWQGKVEFVDSIQRMPGAPKTGVWTPKTYRLCYQRYGDGPFQLTFTEAGIDRGNTSRKGRACQFVGVDSHA